MTEEPLRLCTTFVADDMISLRRAAEFLDQLVCSIEASKIGNFRIRGSGTLYQLKSVEQAYQLLRLEGHLELYYVGVRSDFLYQ